MSDNDFFGGRRRRRAGAAFSPYSLFASGEQGVWYDPSDLTPEKVSWRRNLLTYSQDFENAAWTKSNASILSNLMLYSQDFDNASWVKQTNATVTANTSTAPDGTTTADTLTTTGGTAVGIYYAAAPVSASVAYTASIYAKAGTTTVIRFGLTNQNESAQAYYDFDVANGTIGASAILSFTSVSSSIVSVGSGWYRCIVTATAPASGTTSIGTFTRNTTAGTSLLWGAQVVPGSTAQTYTRSLATAAPVMFSDPLGGTMADKLVENTANSTHRVLPTSPTSGTAGLTYTFSVYVKAAERTFCLIDAFAGTAESYVYVNLSNGAAGNSSGTYTIVDAGNGWYRVTATVLANGTAGLSLNVLFATNGVGTGLTYLGDGVSGIYVYGAQVEQASTASAYQRITDFNSDFLAAFPTHALYQESTGVTPVTALGQSVGLVLDKRLGALTNQGPELVVSPYSGSVSGLWVISSTSITRNGSSTGQATLNLSSLVDTTKRYRVSFTVADLNGDTFAYRVGSGGAAIQVSANGSYSALIVGGGVTNTLIFIPFAGTTGQVTITNISVREVPGNHALQATSASRPTLQARSNLLTQTEDFGASTGWSNVSSGVCTVTLNDAVAPDGSTTADRLTFGGTNSWWGKELLPKPTAGQTFTGSVYIKVADGGADFSLDLVYYPTGGGTNIIQAVTVTSGWQRLSVLASNVTVGTGSSSFVIRSNTTRAVHVWGSQWELNSVPTTYQRVTTATDYADIGLPRNLTFDGVDDSLATAGNVDFATWTGSEARRNLLTHPTMFDLSPWDKNSNGTLVTANAIEAPDGTLTADLVENNPGSANSPWILQTFTATIGQQYTFSVFARAAAGSTFKLWIYNDVTGGAFSSVLTATGAWQRFSLTATIPVGTTLARAGLDVVPLGGIYLWGAQLEVGSTATAFQNVGTDKVSLFSGVYKNSDAAEAMLVELSANWSANNGVFGVQAPPSAAATTYYFVSKGTSLVAVVRSPFAAPNTSVLTLQADIGAPTLATRVNAIAGTTSTSSQGTGNYGSYLLYVGRRGGSSLPFNGRLFQLVIRGAETDSVTVGNAERWVGQLTGVAL